MEGVPCTWPIRLADTAQLTLKSLHVLIDHLPHCVPKFLHRLDTTLRTWKQNGAEPPPVGMDGKSIAQFIKTQDIAGLMRECPEAACALLDYCSLEPEVTSGHNPLPTRVSFAPRTWTQSLQNALNLQNDLLVFHLTDQVWDYNDTTFKMPRWQHAITENHEDRVRGKRKLRRMARRDAEIKICHVPNLLTAEYFQAIVDASDADPAFARFENAVVRSSIHYAFWHGACMYDVLQVAMSLWAVLILVFETSTILIERDDDVSVQDSRILRGRGSGGFLATEETNYGGCLLCDLHVATSWIAAKGFVDFLMEAVQFLGCCKIGQPTSYFTLGNLFDVTRSLATQMLFFHPESKIVNVVVIFFLWLRLLEIFTTAEKVARAILPIRDLAKGLAPALVVFGIGYCAFVHAFFAVKDTTQPVWAQVFHSSFSTLITAAIPEDANGEPPAEMWLCYLAVLMFSIFFLNIFIGVIGELYQVEKDRSELTFQELRAQSVLSFQLRARIMPCALCNATLAHAFALMFFVIIAGVQMLSIVTGQRFTFLALTFTILQIAMVICVFQCPDEVWGSTNCGHRQGNNPENRYLWICKPKPEHVKDVQSLMVEDLPSFLRQVSAESAGYRRADSVRFAVAPLLGQRAFRWEDGWRRSRRFH